MTSIGLHAAGAGTCSSMLRSRELGSGALITGRGEISHWFGLTCGILSNKCFDLYARPARGVRRCGCQNGLYFLFKKDSSRQGLLPENRPFNIRWGRHVLKESHICWTKKSVKSDTGLIFAFQPRK